MRVHRPDRAPAGVPAGDNVIRDPFSGGPWLSGQWPCRAIRQVDTTAFRVVLLGICALPQQALAEQVTRAARRYDLGAIARLPGSFFTFVRTPYGSYAAGDIAGARRLRVTVGGLASHPGSDAEGVPAAVGVHLYDDGALRYEPYWSPPEAATSAAVTGPLLAQRLRMAVRCRAALIAATVDLDDSVRQLLDGESVPLRSPEGRLVLAPTGLDPLIAPTRQARGRLAVAHRLHQARVAVGRAHANRGAQRCPQLPLLDSHVLETALATRPADVRRGLLRVETVRALGA